MAVDALELKPRTAVRLFDAALRLCASDSGVWALTMPAGALFVVAFVSAADAASRHEGLALPTLWVTLAWAVRAISQGAACHHLGQLVLDKEAPSLRRSLWAALGRAPSLVAGAAVFAVINIVLLLPLGLGFFVAGAHLAGYAALMRGRGNVLNIYGTCAQLLGPARGMAPWLQWCGLMQAVLGLNVHLLVVNLLMFGSAVLGFDLVFIERFVSLDNGVWVATVVAIAFALFEPVRAASATLLLIDGRVRQEGLDLLSAVQQLPRRLSKAVAATVVMAVASSVWAAEAEGASTHRVRLARLAEECEIQLPGGVLDDVDAMSARNSSAVNRFVSHLERAAYDDEDCDLAEEQLTAGLGVLREARADAELANAAQARDAASAILERPEFTAAEREAPKPKAEKEDEGENALSRWLRRFFEWLERALRTKSKEADDTSPSVGAGQGFAQIVIVLAAVLLAVVMGALLFQLIRGRKPPTAVAANASNSVTAAPDEGQPSALTKAPESWAGIADEYARRGEYREAIRHLYLALLSRLHRDGAIDYEPTSSNWDYLRHFKGAPERKAPFRTLTLGFDVAWYGAVEVGSEAWAGYRATAEPLLAPVEPSHA